MNSKKQILIVDDDHEIRTLLEEYLTRSGFYVESAEDGQQMHQRLESLQPDLIILDIMLPGDDGFSLCQQIRRDSTVPIIMLTASSDETDRVIGLEIGADDYIAKPFSPRELLARIKALLRRATYTTQSASHFIHFAGWTLDTVKRELHHEHGEQLALSGGDYNLLMLFLAHPNQILSRDDISDATRGRELLPLDRGIDVQISRLRQRLGDNGKSPKLIKTIRGSGYVLTASVSHEK